MKYTRIYADESGESHLEYVNIELTQTDFAPPAPPLNLSPFTPASQYAFCLFPAGWRGDWHPVPKRQIFFFLSGKVKGQVSDGEVRQFEKGDVVLAEDTSGKGHVSWVVGGKDAFTSVVQLPD
jgi:quercetin dioxygenase-like cupin family protein